MLQSKWESMLLNRIIARTLRGKFLNYRANLVERYALIYYKIDGFIGKDNSHTNINEVVMMAKTLNELGFVVDVLDRSFKDFDEIKDKYTIFLGIGTGPSGKNYKNISLKVPSAIKILYTTCQRPDIDYQKSIARYSYFKERTGKEIIDGRINPMGEKDYPLFLEFVNMSDFLFVMGTDDLIAQYKIYNKPILLVRPSLPEGLPIDFTNKNINKKFLYFGGNGPFLKGLDLTVEAFALLEDVEIFLCTPDDKQFMRYYSSIIKEHHNIHYEGFVDVNGSRFKKLVEECSFVILPSEAESMATSVILCMGNGLLPIITHDVMINTKAGFYIEDISPKAIAAQIKNILSLDDNEIRKRLGILSKEISCFTADEYQKLMKNNFLNVLKKNDKKIM